MSGDIHCKIGEYAKHSGQPLQTSVDALRGCDILPVCQTGVLGSNYRQKIVCRAAGITADYLFHLPVPFHNDQPSCLLSAI